MRALIVSLFFVTLATTLPNAYCADPVVVIVNAANQQSLSAQDIKNIYADIITHWKNGGRIHLYNLPADDQARETFSRSVFGESTREILQQEHNRKITNTVKNPSKTKRASLIQTIVARDKNAVAYLPKAILSDSTDLRIVLEIK